jgi:uncharacterized membrane protein YkoI
MIRYWMFTVLLSTGIFAAEKRVKMTDLPAGVQRTVQQQSKGAVIRGLSKEVENGKTYYEAELKVNGHNKDLLIDPTGAIVEVEDEVARDSVPQAAKAALDKQAGKGKVLSIESITKDHALVAYEAKIKTAGGKTTEVRVTPEGTPAKEQ